MYCSAIFPVVTRSVRVHTCSGYDLLGYTDLVVKEQILRLLSSELNLDNASEC